MREYKYYLKKIDKPTPNVVVLEISDIRGRPIFDFQPGQYVMLQYRNSLGLMEKKHSFSIASSPSERRFIRFGIKIGGKFTRGLADLKVGTEIFVQGPYGDFVFDEKKQQDIVMIAGGIGITPFMSSLCFAASGLLSNKLTLLYSNKCLAETLFFNEIRDLEKQNKNIKALFSVTNEKLQNPVDGVIEGRLDSENIRNFLGMTQGKTFFVCGPASFIDAMKLNLSSLKVLGSQIETEEFTMIHTRFWPELKNIAYATGFSAAIMLASFSIINSNKPITTPVKKVFDPAVLVGINKVVTDRLSLISDAKSKALADLNQKRLALKNQTESSSQAVVNMPVQVPVINIPVAKTVSVVSQNSKAVTKTVIKKVNNSGSGNGAINSNPGGSIIANIPATPAPVPAPVVQAPPVVIETPPPPPPSISPPAPVPVPSPITGVS